MPMTGGRHSIPPMFLLLLLLLLFNGCPVHCSGEPRDSAPPSPLLPSGNTSLLPLVCSNNLPDPPLDKHLLIFSCHCFRPLLGFNRMTLVLPPTGFPRPGEYIYTLYVHLCHRNFSYSSTITQLGQFAGLEITYLCKLKLEPYIFAHLFLGFNLFLRCLEIYVVIPPS